MDIGCGDAGDDVVTAAGVDDAAADEVQLDLVDCIVDIDAAAVVAADVWTELNFVMPGEWAGWPASVTEMVVEVAGNRVADKHDPLSWGQLQFLELAEFYLVSIWKKKSSTCY